MPDPEPWIVRVVDREPPHEVGTYATRELALWVAYHLVAQQVDPATISVTGPDGPVVFEPDPIIVEGIAEIYSGG